MLPVYRATGHNGIRKCDGRGNVTYYKDSRGYEEWREYDDDNNVAFSKGSDGIKIWFTYDQHNRLVMYVTHYVNIY